MPANIALLWDDVLSAVENKKNNPLNFKRFYIGKVDYPSHAPIHNRKCAKPTVPISREGQFSLSVPLAGVLLTKREVQVLYLICHGSTNQEVADCLKLSARTAEYYIKNMRKKINATSKANLIQLVVETDFLQRVNKAILEEDK